MEPIRTVPTVACIMLTADRPELARRAVECFRAQTYPAKRLVILDSGVTQLGFESVDVMRGEFYVRGLRGPILPTIGELRNMANGMKHFEPPDILIHWDDDDYSHPNRIAEQVALLQSSGADAVGYNEMLFWRETLTCEDTHLGVTNRQMMPGEAWLYSNPRPDYALGTSLCYWRKTWERRPFAALPLPGGRAGEDQDWLDGIASGRGPGVKLWGVTSDPLCGSPRMIARIHPGNTSTAYDPALMRWSGVQGSGWRRVPQWDSYCRGLEAALFWQRNFIYE